MDNQKTNKGIIIAGTGSGVGKTTITIGIISALVKRGLTVQPFKVGPDFIDPGYHSIISKRYSRNLDGFFLPKERIIKTFCKYSFDADISVIEGVMGLFDGIGGESEVGSTAEIAKILDIPVILVIDAKGIGRSAGAIIYGFDRFDKDLNISGIIFNSVGSERHYEYLISSLNIEYRKLVLGYMKREHSLEIKERHLGLITASENQLSREFIIKLSAEIEKNIDMDCLVKMAKKSEVKSQKSKVKSQKIKKENQKVRIGIAYDKAFSFYYRDNIDILEEMGGTVSYFSPLKDKRLPRDLDGIYIGGGYPEIYAEELAKNESIMTEIKESAIQGIPIYAECGGLIYLSNAIIGDQRQEVKLVGIFPFLIRMLKKRKALGYAEIKLIEDSIIGSKGEVIRGHEFHYSELVKDGRCKGVKEIYEIKRNRIVSNNLLIEKEGYCFNNTLASYIHLHFGSNLECPKRFIRSCITQKDKRK